MDLLNAINNIKNVYEVNKIAKDVAQISVAKMLDDFNMYFVAIKEKDNKVYLTDYGKTNEILNIDDDTLIKICKDFNVECNNYTLKSQYTSNENLVNFINCIDKLKQSAK